MSEFTTFTTLKGVGDRLFYGAASIEVADTDGEVILMEAFAKSLDRFMKYPNLMLMHTSKQIGTILPEAVGDDGTVYRTHITDNSFHIVARIRDDVKVANDA